MIGSAAAHVITKDSNTREWKGNVIRYLKYGIGLKSEGVWLRSWLPC